MVRTSLVFCGWLGLVGIALLTRPMPTPLLADDGPIFVRALPPETKPGSSELRLPANRSILLDLDDPNVDAPDGNASALSDLSAEVDQPSASVEEDSLDPTAVALRDRIRRVLEMYSDRPINARDHTPWEVMHWIIAYNVKSEICQRGPGGERATAVGWLCYNRPCRGQQLLALQGDRVVARYGVGLEGHSGQFMAVLAQSKVRSDYPMLVGGQSFTVADLIESQKLACRAGTELTFQLIGLSHYLDLNETWRNRRGETWSIPRLVREELAKPIQGAACGGTHRLMGLTYVVKRRQKRNEPVDGEYRRASIYIRDYIRYALRLQNNDGSFSTAWFAGREARGDIDRRMQTTGHILEWVIYSVDQERLTDPEIVKSVDYLARLLEQNPRRNWKIGPLGHAVRSLLLYDKLVFRSLESNDDEDATTTPDKAIAEVSELSREGRTAALPTPRSASQTRPVATAKQVDGPLLISP